MNGVRQLRQLDLPHELALALMKQMRPLYERSSAACSSDVDNDELDSYYSALISVLPQK